MLSQLVKIFSLLLVVSVHVTLCTRDCNQILNTRPNINLGLRMYRELAKTPGNLFFSPGSLSFALGLTSLGARGETLRQIINAMNVTERQTPQMHLWFQCVKNNLFEESSDYTLRLANNLYGSRNYTFLNSFLSNASTYYSAPVQSVNFNDKTATLDTINGWVAEKTNNKITNLLKSDDIDALTRLVLINAIYFKADWKQKFNASLTRNENFYLDGNRVVQMPMMHATFRCNFTYDINLKTRVLELPYKGDKLSMIIMLPERGKIKELENSLTPNTFYSFEFIQTTVDIVLPKFKMEPSYSLAANFRNLGIGDLFSQTADLSGMDGSRLLYASSAAHKAFIEVNEEGSEAAAASAVVLLLRTPPPAFEANHPFLFFIRDTQSKEVLFMGRFSGE